MHFGCTDNPFLVSMKLIDLNEDIIHEAKSSNNFKIKTMQTVKLVQNE